MAFDLDAMAADANDEPFVWRFGGHEFSFPAQADIRAIGAMAEGEILRPLKQLLGDDQYARFAAIEAPFDQRRFRALFEAYSAHMGVVSGGS